MKKTFKRTLLTTISACTLAVGLTFSASASETVYHILNVKSDINIFVETNLFIPKDTNGNEVEGFVYNGTTYLPVRALTELLGCEISYDVSTKTIDITTGGVKQTVSPNKTPLTKTAEKTLSATTGVKINIDGVPFIAKDVNGKIVEPYVVAGTTYLPVRALSEEFGLNIGWDDHSQSVMIGEQFEPKLYVNMPDDFNRAYREAKGLYNFIIEKHPVIDRLGLRADCEFVAMNDVFDELVSYYVDYSLSDLKDTELDRLFAEYNRIADTVRTRRANVLGMPRNTSHISIEYMLESRFTLASDMSDFRYEGEYYSFINRLATYEITADILDEFIDYFEIDKIENRVNEAREVERQFFDRVRALGLDIPEKYLALDTIADQQMDYVKAVN